MVQCTSDVALLESLDGSRPFVDLPEFLRVLNESAPVSFTMVTSESELLALDLLLFREEDRVRTRTSFKTTNTFSYVSMGSDHPRHTFRALLMGEFLRMQRVCSDLVTARGNQAFIASRSRQRGYPSSLIKSVQLEVSRLLPRRTTCSSNRPILGPRLPPLASEYPEACEEIVDGDDGPSAAYDSLEEEEQFIQPPSTQASFTCR